MSFHGSIMTDPDKDVDVLLRFGKAVGFTKWTGSEENISLLHNIRQSLYGWQFWPSNKGRKVPLSFVLSVIFKAIEAGELERPYQNQAQFVSFIRLSITPGRRKAIMNRYFAKFPNEKPIEKDSREHLEKKASPESYEKMAITLYGIYGGEDIMKSQHPKIYQEYLRFLDLAKEQEEKT